jgi:hypothetical protein
LRDVHQLQTRRTAAMRGPPAPGGARIVAEALEDDRDRSAGDADAGVDELVPEPVP